MYRDNGPTSPTLWPDTHHQVEQLLGETSDPEAVSWAYLSKEELPRIAFYLRKLGATEDEAQECSQQALAECWERVEGGKSDIENLPAYMRTVAKRIYLRRTPREEPQADMAVHLSVNEDTPQKYAEGNELHERVLRAMHDLPLLQREAIALTYDGYSPAEIAEVTNSHTRRVRVNLYRARETLKSKLSDIKRSGNEIEESQ